MDFQHVHAFFALVFGTGILSLILSDLLFHDNGDPFLDEILPSRCLRQLFWADMKPSVSVEDQPFDPDQEGVPPHEVFLLIHERLPRWQTHVYENPRHGYRKIFCRVGVYWIVLQEISLPQKSWRVSPHRALPDEVTLTLISEASIVSSEPLTIHVPGSGFNRGVVYYIRPREPLVVGVINRDPGSPPLHTDAPQQQPEEMDAAINLARRLWEHSHARL